MFLTVFFGVKHDGLSKSGTTRSLSLNLEFHRQRIDYCTVLCLAVLAMNASEARGDLAIQTSLLFSCKFQLAIMRKT